LASIEYLERIFEIALAAYTEKKDWTEIVYAISVEWHGYPIEVLYAGRILNFKGKFVQSESASAAIPTLERSNIARACPPQVIGISIQII
jgi:hypothetical protein